MSSRPQLTRHGVRNLNGPNMDGTKYNGKRASCPHYRAQDLIPTIKRPIVAPNGAGYVTKFATYCTGCDAQLDEGEA